MRHQRIDNPVTALETRALTRAGGFSLAWPERGWRSRIVWLFRWTLLLGIAAYYALHIAANLFPVDLVAFQELAFIRSVRILFVTIGLVELFTLVVRSLALGSSLITREILAGRWDLLRLTGVAAHQVTWGKALAGLFSLRSLIVYVAVIRVGMSLSLGYSIFSPLYYYANGITAPRTGPWLPALIILPLLALLFNTAVAAFALAIGLFTSALGQHPGRAMVGSGCGLLGLRGALVLCSCNLAQSFTSMASRTSGDSYGLVAPVFASVLDGGTILMGALSTYPNEFNAPLLLGFVVPALLGALGVMVFYGVFITGLLLLTELALKKQGVSAG